MLRQAARLAIILAAGAAPAAAQDVEANIVTGAAAGTDAEIGREIADLAAECGIELNVRESAGSVENMLAVRDRRVTQLGIVQNDVLEYFRTFADDDPALARTGRGIRIAFPLYQSEVHLLAREGIDTLADLGGQRVVTGAPDSGTALTAELILDLAQVSPAERLDLEPEAAIEALEAGEADALFYVGGAPAALFASAALDPAAVHLVPIDDPVVASVYEPAEIAAGTYPFVTEPVPVVSVQSVLVTFNYDAGVNAYQAASCRLVSDVTHLIASRLNRLREDGHPKWRTVDPRAIPDGWTVSDCVLDGADPNYAFTCTRPDGTTVLEGGAAAGGSDANAVFIRRVCAQGGC